MSDDIDLDLLNTMDFDVQKPIMYFYMRWDCTPVKRNVPLSHQKFWRRNIHNFPFFIQGFIDEKYPILTEPKYEVRHGGYDSRKILLKVPGPDKYYIRLVYDLRDTKNWGVVRSLDFDIDLITYRQHPMTGELIEYEEMEGIDVDILELDWEDEIETMLRPLPQFKKQNRARTIGGLLNGY